MNYRNIYSNLFNNSLYSCEYHSQYDWTLELLNKKFQKDEKITIIDIGSGRGHLLKKIHEQFPNAIITSVDLDNYHKLDFVKFFKYCDITSIEDRRALLGQKYDCLINLDFLEHIEEKYIDDILSLFSNLSSYCIIAVANHSDIWNGNELHLIQKNINWWKEKIETYFKIIYINKNKVNTLYFFEICIIPVN